MCVLIQPERVTTKLILSCLVVGPHQRFILGIKENKDLIAKFLSVLEKKYTASSVLAQLRLVRIVNFVSK